MDASDPFACIKITKIHKQDSTRYINHESLYDKTNAEDSGDIQMEAKGLIAKSVVGYSTDTLSCSFVKRLHTVILVTIFAKK